MDDLEAVLRGMQSASPRGSMQVALRTSQRRRLQAASEQASMMSMSDDMDSILRHPLFPRLKRAVLACQQVGLDDEEEANAEREPAEDGIRVAESRDADTTLFMEHYCQLFEQLRAHVEDFDERLQSDMRVYYRELTDALAHATPRSDTCEASAHCSDADKAALRTRHRQTITDVKRKIIQKQKKSRLPETAVASLKAWWEDNSGHPFPSEDVKKMLCHEAGLTLVQVNNWFINKRKRSKPKGS